MRGDDMSLKLIYGDIPLGANEDAAVSVTDKESFSSPASLPFGVNTGAVATLERNSWGLSTDYKVRASQPFSLWSESVSDAEGAFAVPPQITLDFDNQYTATGLTFRFYPGANEYCPEIGVSWYQNGVLKDSGTFYPSSVDYTLENTVEAFNRVVITINKTSLPGRRAKIEHIGIGIIRVFDGKELTSASFINELDFISETLPANVMDASFHSSTDTEYIFQKKQPVEAYDGESLIGVYYIESGERTGARDYSISCQDAIGTLDLDTYAGGLWLTDTPITELISSVVNGAFEVDISSDLTNIRLRGHIPKCSKREALQQIAFAAGVCIDTSGTAKIKVFAPPTGAGAEIPESETYTGGSVKTSDVVTAVSLASYDILTREIYEDDEIFEYNGQEYALWETRYVAENPNVSAGTLPNVVELEGCYLINQGNGQARANAILSHYMRRNLYTAAHVLNGQKLGERVTVSLPWGGTVSANIRKMTLTISGINASESEFLLD